MCYNHCPNPPPAKKLWLSLPCPVEVPVGHVFRVCSKGVDPEAGGLQVPEFVENILGIQPELAKLEGGEKYVRDFLNKKTKKAQIMSFFLALMQHKIKF